MDGDGRKRCRKNEIRVRPLSPGISFLRQGASSTPLTASVTTSMLVKKKGAKKRRRVVQQKLTKFMSNSVDKNEGINQEEEDYASASSTDETPEKAGQSYEVPTERQNLKEVPGCDSENEDREIVQDSCSTEEIKKRPLFRVPAFWLKYFVYNGHVIFNGTTKNVIVMTCLLCENNPDMIGKNIKHRGAPWSNFNRHLQKSHPFEHKAEVNAGNLSGGNGTNRMMQTAIIGTKSEELKGMFHVNLWSKPKNDNAYDMSHPNQKKFVTDVMDLVAVDSFPLDTPERPMFIKMFRNWNPSLRVFSRRTLTRRFSSYYTKEFLPLLKSSVKDIKDLGCNIILDLWTDRQKSSMLGVKAQFITSDWKLRNTAVAFRHFEGQHSSAAIKRIFDDILKTTLELQPQQVGFVVGDSASNMKSAFLDKRDCVESSECNNDDEPEEEGTDDDWVDYETFFRTDEDIIEEELLEESEVVGSIQIEVPSWTDRTLEKLPCFCHLLQLIIKDAIGKCPSISRLIEDVNAVKAFFHRVSYWYDELKATAGKGLINQATTRWGSIYFVLERLSEKKMQEALNAVLEKTRLTKNACRVTFSVVDYNLMKATANLLRPLIEATNTLQADKVTFSMVIPQIAGAYESIRDENVDNMDAHEFKEALMSCIEERFQAGALARETRQTHITRLKTITRTEIFNNEKLVLATVLDPRLKLAPFLDDENDRLNLGACSTEKASTILVNALRSHNLDCSGVAQASPSVQCAAPGSLLKYLEKRVAASSITLTGTHAEESLKYLDKSPVQVDTDPLVFWKVHAGEFPRLAQLAKIYLAVPASSGSVERLFSIAGAVQRARRARLQWKTIENLLCYRECRVFQLFGKHV